MNTKELTLFITDDDADDRMFITSVLVEKGFNGHFKEFEDGDAMLQYFNSHPNTTADLILLDLNMPHKNGFETLKELKKDGGCKGIPVFILTASSKQEDEKNCYELGCCEFIRKPMSMSGYEKIADGIMHFVSRLGA